MAGRGSGSCPWHRDAPARDDPSRPGRRPPVPGRVGLQHRVRAGHRGRRPADPAAHPRAVPAQHRHVAEAACSRRPCPRGPTVASSLAMKIARIEALHCDGGWRPWTFVRVETDDGLVGWGECSDNRSPHGIAGCVRDLADLLVGQDPRPVERLYSECCAACGRTSPPSPTVASPGEPATVYFPGFASGINTTDGAPTVEILDAIDRLIGTFRHAVGPRVGLCLDLNYNFRTEGVLRIARLLEKYDMQWLEYDNWDPDALLQIKQSTSTRLASLESLVTLRQFRPFLERHAVDVAIIDVPWNGFSQAVQIGRLAEACEINVAPHNYYSHLADLHSLHLCAVLPNVRIMEIDVDDVPWKGALVTRPPLVRDAHVSLTDAPGWGADIDERVLREPPWPRPGETGARLFYGMDPGQMTSV